MSILLTINGTDFNYPQVGDVNWGAEATDWAAAVTTGMLQKSGGLFQLLGEVDFGSSYGIKSLYLKSRTTNPASAGQIRLAVTDVINFRNNANGADLSLGVNASDELTFNSIAIQGKLTIVDTTTIDLTLSSYNLSADIKALSITDSLISASAAIAYSKLSLSNSIVNGDISSSAAIAYSKLSLSNSIVNGDISSTAAIAYSKLSLSNSIVNGDISSSAAIALSKLEALTSGHIIVGSATNVATSVAVSGDITINDTGVTAIGSNKVANSQLAQMAAHTFKGNNTASTANASDLTATQLTAELDVFVGDSGSGGTKGLVKAPSTGDAAKFLKGDGTWSVPAGAGDVNGPASSTDNAVVRFDLASGKIIQNSGVIIDDSNNVTGIAALTATGTTTLATSLTGPLKAASGVVSASAIALASEVSGTLPIANGGTAVTSLPTTKTASAFAAWDANSNLSAANFIEGYTTTATAAGTTTLTVASTYLQYFTGSTTQTVVLPVTSTLVLGQQFQIVNNSTGVVTVQSSGANNIILLPAGASTVLTCILTSGTTAASWFTPGGSIHRSEIRVTGKEANGSTNTKVARFTTVSLNTGTAISITQSTTLGDIFTINEPGIYHVSFSTPVRQTSFWTAISVNCTQLTTSITAISDGSLRSIGYDSAGNTNSSQSWSGYLTTGDKVYLMRDEGTVTTQFAGSVTATIVKISG